MPDPISIAAFIFILGGAVILHEFGHFAVAKLFGIRVETFSVGFGKRLFGKKWGTTDYRVSLLPLGGYVKLGGDESNSSIEGAGESDIPVAEQFSLRPKYQRFLVALGGPAMNILTALSIPLAAGLMNGVPVTPSSIVANVRDGGSSWQAGLRPGDRIVSFNGTDDPLWSRMKNDAAISPNMPIPMVVERAGRRINLTITPAEYVEGNEKIGELDFLPDYGELPVIVSLVVKDAPAETAGLQVGDQLISINGEKVKNTAQATHFIRESRSDSVRVTVKRGTSDLDLTSSVNRGEDRRAKIGIVLSDLIPFERVGISGATGYAVRQNLEILRVTKDAIWQIAKGQRSARDTLSGPIGIYQATGKVTREAGWAGVFGFMAFLSLNLGVMNLLPIPVLDGGAIFMLFVEAMLGYVGVKLSMVVRERIQTVGLVMLLLLMGFVITNDVIKTFFPRSNTAKPPATQQK